MTIELIQTEIIKEFAQFPDWERKYEYLINLGKKIQQPLDQHLKNENLVKGCNSLSWIHAQAYGDRIFFSGYSESIVVTGIMALLFRVYSAQRPEDILSADTGFIDEIGLKEHLSPNRANGLIAIINHIKNSVKNQ